MNAHCDGLTSQSRKNLYNSDYISTKNVCAQETSNQTLATWVAFARAIKKTPIVVNDGPGFYVSRELGGLFGGTVYLVADGVEGAQIEKS